MPIHRLTHEYSELVITTLLHKFSIIMGQLCIVGGW